MAYADELARLTPYQYRAPRRLGVGDEEELSMFLPESEIIGVQEQIAEAGRGANRPYVIPSREELQQHGFQQLRKLLGLQAIEQAAKERTAVLPKIYEGQYRVASERAKAQAAAEAAERSRQGAMERVQAQETARTGRAERGIESREKIAGAGQSMRERLQRLGQAFAESQDIRRGKAGPTGLMNWLKQATGLAPSREELATQRMQGALTEANQDAANWVRQAQEAGYNSPEEVPGAEQLTPEEMAEVLQLWGQ